jgi:two-component system response regulator HydG
MQADKGTIFLDEVGEMPMVMQAKLLRVVQEREIQRVGGEKTITVDVRVIAATNQDLSDLSAAGKFREDLYYRLNVVSMNIPPLRERVEDVPLLAHHFLNVYSDKNNKTIKGFTPIAMDMLLKYDWPGNVRELENAVERAVILSLDEYINEKVLPMTITEHSEKSEKKDRLLLPSDEAQPLEEVEREMILSTLKAVEGNKSEAARKLGINRRTLYNKLQKYGLD